MSHGLFCSLLLFIISFTAQLPSNFGPFLMFSLSWILVKQNKDFYLFLFSFFLTFFILSFCFLWFFLSFYFSFLQFCIQNDRRNMKFTFQTNNNFRCGLNCLSNRFKSITNDIKNEWTLFNFGLRKYQFSNKSDAVQTIKCTIFYCYNCIIRFLSWSWSE